MTRAFLGIMLLFQLVSAGCSVSKQPGRPLEDPVLSQGLRQKLERLYPPSFQASHRCILEAAGRQFVLEGYLRVYEPESFRLLAKGDMGGTVFELQQVKGEKPEVVKNPVSLRPSWLLEGAARHNLNRAWSGIRPGTQLWYRKLSLVFGKNFASSLKPAACLPIC
jgi:hypothetical protein